MATKADTTAFAEVQGVSFLEAIMIRGNCLPARVSRPEDLIRLELLGINYATPVDGVKLTSASIPDDWRFELDKRHGILHIDDDLGVERMVVREEGGVPVLEVRPLYGFTVLGPYKDGLYQMTIYYPDGSTTSFKRPTGGKDRDVWLKEAEEFVSSVYKFYYYSDKWRELGAALPT